MKMKAFIKNEWPLWISMLIPALYLFLFWNRLPENLPIHWGINGKADNFAPKYIPLLIQISLYLLLLVIPYIDPRKNNYELFSDSYKKLRLILLIFFGLIIVLTIQFGLGNSNLVEKLNPILIFALFILIGNYMSTIRSNFFIGIKTPWTLASDTVWRKTHEMGGKLWFWGGITGCIAGIFIQGKFVSILMISIISVLVVVPIAYSYILFRKDNK
jgi:uncharacterized membrane protein